MPAIVREHPFVAAASVGYVAALLVAALLWGRSQTPFYAVFMGLLLALVARVYERRPLSTLTLAGLSLWGLGHMVGGLVEVEGAIVYEWMVVPGTLRFDKVVHAFGFGFATMACFEVLRPSYRGPARGVAAFAALGGMGLGALNEMIEFLIARYSASSNVGGFVNTGWDLVFNTVGAIVAATYCVIRRRA
jgi:uncharacterized membrane protein YjdF